MLAAKGAACLRRTGGERGTMRFQDKVAVITAMASGIGRATADIMAAEGAIVVGVDNNGERLDAAVTALREAGGRAHGRVCDALDPAQVDTGVGGDSPGIRAVRNPGQPGRGTPHHFES